VLEKLARVPRLYLNTFQTNLRRRARGYATTVAQRLKRRPTIIDKLKREPTMQLNMMHDIAGCRLIFQKEQDIIDFD
jgi:ppGpp synthetase/RelA/SpoT-type nucleotidyltranferase